MGKSLGNTIEPNDLVSKFGPDAVRYFFLREVEFGNDGDYSEDRFINIVNAHLANTIGISSLLSEFFSWWIFCSYILWLCFFGFWSCIPFSGNLLNRTLGLLKKNCQSTLVTDSSIAAEGTTFKDSVEKLVNFFIKLSCHVFQRSVSQWVICKPCSCRYLWHWLLCQQPLSVSGLPSCSSARLMR